MGPGLTIAAGLPILLVARLLILSIRAAPLEL